MVIGLDVSTSVVGISALGDDGSLVYITHIDFGEGDEDGPSTQRLGSKGDLVRDELLKIHAMLSPGETVKVFIEAAAKRMSQFSNADTLFLLARFNGIVSYIAYTIFGVEVTEVNVSSARSTVGIVFPKFDKGITPYAKKRMIKDTVINFVLAHYPEDLLGFEKTRYGNWQVWCGDRADSLVIARYGHNPVKPKKPKAPRVPKKKKGDE